ncbi:hypothetical protein CFIO01_09508 [Colletotrichum fioriniae PJ7]|uniref:Uncharacterized protein n=1 Tax=Colletotrichum fioriniae PJ7 TaxID=1445577 RepID=A0A010RFL1_9PEZI|nr:hypothetical protein CFIO01_09508 [Colletotrichum fioriniae PJ7]
MAESTEQAKLYLFPEKGFPRDAVIAGSTTFLKEGGVSFKIRENMEDRDFQAENCKELVIAVLGYMAYWEVEWQQRRQRQREEQQEHDIRVLSPLRLNAILLEDNTKNYAALRRKFSDRASIPEAVHCEQIGGLRTQIRTRLFI